MTPTRTSHTQNLARRLSEAEATIEALLSGQIDAVVDSKSKTPVLLSKAQDALRESEERYRLIVEATTDGIVKLDAGARIVFANRRFAEMLGHDPLELIGTSIFAFMNEPSRAIAVELFKEKTRSTNAAVDTTLRHQDGTDISVNMTGTLLLDAAGQPVGNLAVVRDVTEQKKLQSQLMVSDRMASVGTLAAGVAHEINNPLAAVVANLDYIAESMTRRAGADSAGLSPEAAARFLKEIQEPLDDARDGAQRVRIIVRDLKIFSRVPTDEATGPVDVRATMESSLVMAWNEIRHRARLVKEYGRIPGVEANEARLGQVFLNLIVNAAQALPEGRADDNEIRIATWLEDERVMIEVRDSGPGIPPEIIGRIFDAFFTTKAVGAGTGLGLAISQRIVTDMGGTLTVESEVGKGTKFRVALPVAREKTRGAVATVQAHEVSGRSGRILVVDDEMLVVTVVRRVLSIEHEVIATVSAKEALQLIVGGDSFDLILCDLMMPDMTGMEFHEELLRVAPEQANRMIFLTGGAFTPKGRQFLAETPKEHIEKPFDVANLRAIVRRYLR